MKNIENHVRSVFDRTQKPSKIINLITFRGSEDYPISSGHIFEKNFKKLKNVRKHENSEKSDPKVVRKVVQKWTRKWSKSGPKSDPKSDPKSVTDWNRSPFAARGLELVKRVTVKPDRIRMCSWRVNSI